MHFTSNTNFIKSLLQKKVAYKVATQIKKVAVFYKEKVLKEGFDLYVNKKSDLFTFQQATIVVGANKSLLDFKDTTTTTTTNQKKNN